MDIHLPLSILPQPDNCACGPTCLHAVYNYYGEQLRLDAVIADIQMLEAGGTLAVFLACDALKRGYKTTIYTYNLQIFDPSWFLDPDTDISDRLRKQAAAKDDPKLQKATRGYLEFLELGGRIRFIDLTPRLIRGILRRGLPILTGLSATYLYRTKREFGPKDDYDDLRGNPSGHFVVLNGYHRQGRTVLITDPMLPNPFSATHAYPVNIDRVICSILLGVLTNDANLLVIHPRNQD